MPVVGGKGFSLLSGSLERLADGVKQHGKGKDYPSHLKEPELRRERAKLEDLRESYESLQAQADAASTAYRQQATAMKRRVSSAVKSLLGFYEDGVAADQRQALLDHGITPPKRSGARARKTAPGANGNGNGTKTGS